MPTTEQQKNGYEDEDFRTVLGEMDEMDEEADAIMASAKGKVSAIRKRQKNRIKIADKELNIPSDVLRAVRAQRKLERKLADIAASLPNDKVELYADAAGQFSWLPPDEEHPEDTAAQTAARKRKAEIDKVTEAEQAEGEAVLKDLVH